MLSPATSRKLSLLLFPALLLLAIALLAAACSVGGDAGGGGDTPAPPPPTTFTLSMGDNFFDPNEFTVSPGQQLTFNLTNDGLLPHNMHIAGTDNTYGTTFCEPGGDEPCSDPEIVNPGDDAVLTWTAPQETGTFVFRCDLHPVIQIGTITVR